MSSHSNREAKQEPASKRRDGNQARAHSSGLNPLYWPIRTSLGKKNRRFGGVSTVSTPRTGKSISISLSFRSCVRAGEAKLRERERKASLTLGLSVESFPSRLRFACCLTFVALCMGFNVFWERDVFCMGFKVWCCLLLLYAWVLMGFSCGAAAFMFFEWVLRFGDAFCCYTHGFQWVSVVSPCRSCVRVFWGSFVSPSESCVSPL